jgi:hypothetical protein
MNVFILTYCRNMDLFYGTGLVFKTLRVGFPNTRVKVVDNASIPQARAEIEALAKENECLFEQIQAPGIEHHDFLQNTIRAAAEGASLQGPLVFLDPDVCLWDSWEDVRFEGLMAGKLRAKIELNHALLMPRIDTSFLWIPDAKRLHNEIRKIKATHFDFHPFLSFSFKMDGTWYRYDTGASLYAVISDRVSYFRREHFARYDHIQSGSHVDLLWSCYDRDVAGVIREIHGFAREGNLEALKGIWRRQYRIWRRHFVDANHDIPEGEDGREEEHVH